MITKKELLTELISRQRKNIPQPVLLGFKDLNRIINNIDKSIFDNECTIWKGFIHSYKNNHYINFFYKGSKKNLSRLLYYNFVGKIDEIEYIKNICKNGKCCNINHYQKFKKDLIKNNEENHNDNHNNNHNNNHNHNHNHNDNHNNNNHNDDNNTDNNTDNNNTDDNNTDNTDDMNVDTPTTNIDYFKVIF